MRTTVPISALIALAACGRTAERARTAEPAPGSAEPAPAGRAIAPEPQRPGDPARGWRALTEEGYVGCGVPRPLYDRMAGELPERLRLPGRTGRGAELPYFMNAYTTPAGVDVVTANCLGCHAGFLRGELVVGLGDASADFTYAFDGGSAAALAGLFAGGAAGRAEFAKLSARTAALGPHIRTRTVGTNPADHIAAVLFAHRDPQTLAWSDAPLIPLPDEAPIPVDVPAWWLLKKKAAMFWTGAGRGDQARIMMTASVLCVDDVATARAVDAYFPDLRAFVLSLEPPRYPGSIDGALAERGRAVFGDRCARCHGRDGSYQTQVIPLRTVGTDPALAEHAGQFAAPFVAWFNASFYGEVARLEPGAGYVAPPLDGVWATAPYLHNGSVPTLAAILDSSLRRDRTWIARGADQYDLDTVGWNTPDFADDGQPSKWIYDARQPGYGNQGHTFGDRLTADDRRALLEYLKSL